MDAYLSCPQTRQLLWLGKPIRTIDGKNVVFYSQNAYRCNHDNPLLNKVLWKFLAEHAHMELRVVFSGEFRDDDYEHVSTHDVEAEEYVKGWPPSEGGEK